MGRLAQVVGRGKRQRDQGAALRPELRQSLENGEGGADSSRPGVGTLKRGGALILHRCQLEGPRASCPTPTTWTQSTLEWRVEGQEEEQCEEGETEHRNPDFSPQFSKHQFQLE